MNFKQGGRRLAAILAVPGLLVWLAIAALAQVVTTQVTDTIYRADGSPAGGTVLISWPAFTTATGQTVASGSTSATLSSAGVFSVQLAPNAGATPLGTYYTVVYHLNDGNVNREYWVVPTSQTPVAINAVRSSVLPTSVAMQTVSKSYVDTAIANALNDAPSGGTPGSYVSKSGDTMTGPLVLPGDPVTPTQAADKNYVDNNITALASGIAQKVSTLPQTTQVVSQPSGTDLEVNRLNSVQYTTQYVNGHGNNGIANVLATPDCAGGCQVNVEQTYNSTENYDIAQTKNGTHIEDLRGGGHRDSYLNPESAMEPGAESGQMIFVASTRSTAEINQATRTRSPASLGLRIVHRGLTGGTNYFPGHFEATPYFKTGFSALSVDGLYNSQGQHVLNGSSTRCYGVGDCLLGGNYILASGGFRDNADEGAHPFDIQIREDSAVFDATCTSGCTTGSTAVTLTATANAGTQGDGRYLINMNPAKTITTGQLIGPGASGPNASASFSGTSFAVSTFFQISQAMLSQEHDMAPGTVTVAINTTGLPSGFSSSTAAAPAQSGVACIADPAAQVYNLDNFETANYIVVDATHVQLTLSRPHAAQATLAIGGLCGYGLEQTVDTVNNIRQVFPVIGSYSSTGLYYAGGATAVIGIMGSTSAYTNISLPITSLVRSANTVTVTTAGNIPKDVNGLTLTIAGATDASYNGSFVATTIGANRLTYTQTGADSTSSGGTISLLTGSYVLYPMAEARSVMNPATQKVDGQMTLAPNTVAWAAGDVVEQPHYFQEKVSADLQYIGQTTPRPSAYQIAGVQYEGNNGPGLQGWMINNAAPVTNYFGNGGTHSVPDVALITRGVWQRAMVLDAGEQAAFSVHCNSHGCNKWNSSYNLFELSSAVGADTVNYAPATSALNMYFRGVPYSFTPQGFTAGTINATTINATTLNAPITASQIPVFKPSGTTHAQGGVPDPGAAAGAGRYLREDGTWSVPVGGDNPQATALPVGATADYNFKEGTGTTVPDHSGNGNDAIFASGANAPTWAAKGGLAFTTQGSLSQLQLPSALNSTRTFFIAVYVNPLWTVGLVPSSQPVMISSSMGIAGYNFMHIGSGPNIDSHYGNAWSFRNYANGGTRATTYTPYSGFHVLGITLGTGGSSVDHFYLDGMEVGSYLSQAFSAGFQTSGNLYLGSSLTGPFAGSGFTGTVYRFLTYNDQLTSSQMADTSWAIRKEIESRGVAVTPQPIPLSTPQLHAVGDSITYGTYNNSASYSWTTKLALTNQPAWQIQNWGVVGASVEDLTASEPNRVGLRCASASGPSVAVLFVGTNSFAELGVQVISPALVFQHLGGEVRILKQAGCKVFVGTMISRPGYDAVKDAYNALILSQYKMLGADGVVDFAANPNLGADGANANMTYFATDGTHPKNPGQDILAAEASNALNYYFGYNDTNPNYVTSLPYSMAAGDGTISLSGVTSGGTLTLPDCTGQSGAVYRITNPQSTYAVTVAPLNGNQLINGLPLTSPVTVPANGSLVLHDVPNPKTVAGCHWEM